MAMKYRKPIVHDMERLKRRSSSTDKTTSVNAIRTLGSIGTPEAVKALTALLKESNQTTSVNAARTLGAIGTPEAVKALITLLKKSQAYDNESALTAAVKALAEIGDESAVEPVTEFFEKTRYFHHEAAAALLKFRSPKAIPRLIRVVEQKDYKSGDSARLLGQIGHPEAVPGLIIALDSSDDSVAANAAEALGLIGDSRALEPLAAVWGKYNTDFEIPPYPWPELHHRFLWANAAVALARLGDTRAVRRLYRSDVVLPSKQIYAALRELKTKIPLADNSFFCKQCLTRAREYTSFQGWFIVWLRKLFKSYYACRTCHSNQYLAEGVKKTVLLLDNRDKGELPEVVSGSETLVFNWFNCSYLVDYDEIWIRNADDVQVEEMVMVLMNDTVVFRRERLKDIPVIISPHLELSPAKMNLLKANLKVVQSAADSPASSVSTPTEDDR